MSKRGKIGTHALFATIAMLLFATRAYGAMTYSNATAAGVTQTGVSALQTDINSTSGVTYTATFDYGTSTSYGTNIPGATGANNVPSHFVGTVSSVAITGLTCGTTYHYRLNVAAASTDVDHTFTTSACSIPTVSEWGMIFLTVVFAAVIFIAMRRRPQPPAALG